MAPLMHLNCKKVSICSFILFILACSFFCAYSKQEGGDFVGRRLLKKEIESDQEEEDYLPKKITSSSSKNQTKIIKLVSSSTKNETEVIKKINLSSKNQTKLTNGGTKLSNTTKSFELKNKLSSAAKSTNSSKSISGSLKKPSDSSKIGSAKNKTSKPTSTETQTSKISVLSEKKNGDKDVSLSSSSSKPNKKTQNTDKIEEIKPIWLDDEEDDDLVTEFRDLPSRFQQTLIPDLKKISKSSKIYINNANKEITRNFKPYFGNKYSPAVASAVSCIFIFVPLLLVTLVFNRFKAYFSLQKVLIFIQVYLSIYFSILCLSSLVSGLEPLRFFYATSRSTYIWLQVLQTLGYSLYLLLLLMFLVLVFSTECGLGLKVLGMAQIFVGLVVGLDYYVAVFHRVMLGQPPKTNWKVHGVYATCFFMICLFNRAERRKKEYLEDGGEEGKKN